MIHSLPQIESRVPRCTRCPELRAYCAEVGRVKRKAYRDWDYWARPVPGFGDHQASLWIVGLGPGAHGANRTGRMFTGDRSGDFLYAALHRAGLAGQSTATSRDDGLTLRGVYISAALRCAPPNNRPTKEQLDHCRSYLVEEWEALPNLRVILALGSIAWETMLLVAAARDIPIPRPRPKFAHGAQAMLGEIPLLACYHVSQQNVFTGRLTERMFDDIVFRAAEA